MAVIAFSTTQPSLGPVAHRPSGVPVLVQWPMTTSGDTGAPVSYPDATLKSVQVEGSSIGITMQGSNDGTNWETLLDDAGTPGALTFAAVGLRRWTIPTVYVRPSCTSTGTSTVTCLFTF